MTPDILVIDDDEEICSFIKVALEDAGYAVATEEDGAALRVARTHPPRLILLDLMMPVMDGYEVGRHLQDDPATTAVPIIVMSAAGAAQAAARQLGAAGYLVKPFSLAQLDAVVATYAQ